MTASSLDIILPCYNPQPGWEDKIIQQFRQLCELLPAIRIQIILVDDGSVPSIAAESFNKIKTSIFYFISISLIKNSGKGYALREGVKLSESDIVIYTDVDFPFTTGSIIKIWNAVTKEGADVAAGVLDQYYYRQVPAARKIMSKLLRGMTKILLRTKIADTQRGLKGFNEKGKVVFLQTTIDHYLFDLEFIYLASKKKYRIQLVPVKVELNENVRFTKMKTPVVVREGFNFLRLFMRSLIRL